jgi:hypothetical protein
MKLLFRPKSMWIGLHYSSTLGKYCLNIIPSITITWYNVKGKAIEPKVKKYFKKIEEVSREYDSSEIHTFI